MTDPLLDRALDTLLEEAVGGAQPPDLAAAIIACSPEQRRAAMERAQRRLVRHPMRRLFLAAAVLLGCAAVFAVAFFGQQDGTDQVTQDPDPGTVWTPAAARTALAKVRKGSLRVLGHPPEGLFAIKVLGDLFHEDPRRVDLRATVAGAVALERATFALVVERLQTALRGLEQWPADPQPTLAADAWLDLPVPGSTSWIRVHIREGNHSLLISGPTGTTGALTYQGKPLSQDLATPWVRSFRVGCESLGVVPHPMDITPPRGARFARDLPAVTVHDFGPKDLPLLAYFSALKRLDLSPSAHKLSRTALTPSTWPNDLRAALGGLEELRLRFGNIDDPWLRDIASLMPKLHHLDLSWANIKGMDDSFTLTGTGFAAFAGSDLRSVTLRGCPGLSPTGIATVCALPSLIVLDLTALENSTLKPKDLAPVQKAIGLQVLRLGWRHRSSFPPLFRTNEALRFVDGLPRLTVLDLSNTEANSDGLKTLRALPALKYVSMRGCQHLKGDEAQVLAERFPHLRSLDLVGANAQGVMAIKALGALPAFQGVTALLQLADLPAFERLELSHDAFTAENRTKLRDSFGGRVHFER